MATSPSVAETLRRSSGLPRDGGQSSLPPETDLIGRQSDVAEITKQIEEANHFARVLIYGPHGVGKSSLAIVIAHQLVGTGRYQRAIWIDCQEQQLDLDNMAVRPGALTTAHDVLRELAVFIGEHSILRMPEQDQMLALKYALARQSTLIVADEVSSLNSDSLTRLLCSLPQGVDVIATGGSESTNWNTTYRLQPLKLRDEQTLLGRLLEGTPVDSQAPEMTEISGLIGGIPLTMRWVADMLRGGQSVADVKNSLRKKGGTISEYYFLDHWNQLSTSRPTLNALLALSIWNAPTNVDDFANLLSAVQTPDDTRVAITKIDSRTLLEWSDGNMRLRPLARVFVVHQYTSTQDAFDELVGIWVTNFAEQIRSTQRIETWRIVFALPDAMRMEIFSACGCAIHLQSSAAKRSMTRFIESITYWMFCRGYWNELLSLEPWIEAVGAMLITAVSYELTLTWAVKIVKWRNGAQAARVFTEGRISNSRLAMHGEWSQLRLQVVRSSLRDRAALTSGDADDLMRVSVALKARNDHEWSTRARQKAGVVYGEVGHYMEAFATLQALVAEIDADPHPPAWAIEARAVAYGNLGINSNRTGDNTAAVSYLEECLMTVVQSSDEAVARAELAIAYEKLDRMPEASKSLMYARTLAVELGLNGTVVESDPGWDLSSYPRLTNASLARRAVWKLRAWLKH